MMNSRILFLVPALIFSLPAQAVFTDDDFTRQIAMLRQRAIQAVDISQPDTLYMQAKADAWLDFAFEEYIEHDAIDLTKDAFQQASQLVALLEGKQPEGEGVPGNIRGTVPVREDLWSAIANARQNPQGYRCAAPYLGRAEVQLILAAYEQPELGPRHARRYIIEAEQLLKEAERQAHVCPEEKAAQAAPTDIRIETQPQDEDLQHDEKGRAQ